MASDAERDILLIGGAGQIGSAIRRLAPLGWRIAAPSRSECDITDADSIRSWAGVRRWAAVINTAAYTDVDAAETDAAAAWSANALGPAVLAEATARAGAPLIHLSTDYVFDGRKPTAYVEDDAVGPLNVYGASKEGGEQAVRTSNGRHVILRTAWVVSGDGRNFIKTMLQLAIERPALRVVADQYGCPTGAADIASAVALIAGRLIEDPAAPVGTYHYVNDGEASWCDLARAIFTMSAERGAAAPLVEAIAAADYPRAARRPANSRLSTAKLRRDFGIAPRPWRAAVEEIVDLLLTRSEGIRR